MANRLDLYDYGQKMAKKYAKAKPSLLAEEIEMRRALDMCVVCGADLEEYTSQKGNTYMANKGTAIIHFIYNTCCYTWADVNEATETYEAFRHTEPVRTKNTDDYIEAPLGTIR